MCKNYNVLRLTQADDSHINTCGTSQHPQLLSVKMKIKSTQNKNLVNINSNKSTNRAASCSLMHSKAKTKGTQVLPASAINIADAVY